MVELLEGEFIVACYVTITSRDDAIITVHMWKQHCFKAFIEFIDILSLQFERKI